MKSFLIVYGFAFSAVGIAGLVLSFQIGQLNARILKIEYDMLGMTFDLREANKKIADLSERPAIFAVDKIKVGDKVVRFHSRPGEVLQVGENVALVDWGQKAMFPKGREDVDLKTLAVVIKQEKEKP